MANQLCVAWGELSHYANKKNVGYIVYGDAKDDIYFYDVDSCLAAAFFLKGNAAFVGVHLSLMPIGVKDSFDPIKSADSHLEKIKKLKGLITHAAFAGIINWAEAAAKMCKDLKIPNAVFREEPDACDAWAQLGGYLMPYSHKLNDDAKFESLSPPSGVGVVKVKAGVGYSGSKEFTDAMGP